MFHKFSYLFVNKNTRLSEFQIYELFHPTRVTSSDLGTATSDRVEHVPMNTRVFGRVTTTVFSTTRVICFGTPVNFTHYPTPLFSFAFTRLGFDICSFTSYASAEVIHVGNIDGSNN